LIVFTGQLLPDSGRSRNNSGFGLGLPISHWAVEAHGGSIDVANKPGNGALFRIRLPLALARA
jgi:two-component system OmpR family sensor kinase